MKLPILSGALAALLPCASLCAADLLLVTNKGDHALSLVDPVAMKEIGRVDEEGITGHELAASADGKLAYVPIYGNSGVGKAGSDGQVMDVIDLATRKIVRSLDFGKPVRCHCPVLNPKDGMLYVTTELENSVSVVDPKTLQVVGTVPTEQAESHMLALSHDGKRGYTANVGPGTVSVLDLENRKLLKIIPISKHTQRICISPDDKWVFTADQYQPRMVAIDTATNEVAKTVELPDSGYGSAVTPDGKWLIVAIPNLNEVGFVNLETMKYEKSVKVSRAPQEILIRPDGATAYASCDASAQVAAIDVKEAKLLGFIAAGKFADGLAWAKGE